MSPPQPARQDRLLVTLIENQLAALVVTDPANVRYLTGYVGSNGIALVGVNGRFLLTDSRYAVSATEQVQGAEVVIGTRDLLGDVASLVADVSGGGPIGVEAENLTLARHGRLVELLGGLATEPTRGVVEDLREIKDADEVAAMREAAAVIDRTLARVLDAGIVGRSERAVAFSLLEAMLDEGAEEPSFPTIVASGPRGARPHHVPGPRPDRARHPGRDRHGRGGQRLLLGHDADGGHRAAAGAARGDLRGVPGGPGGGDGRRPGGHGRKRAGRGCPRGDRRGRVR